MTGFTTVLVFAVVIYLITCVFRRGISIRAKVGQNEWNIHSDASREDNDASERRKDRRNNNQ